ncbi:NTP transferase domain-containing protein [candidate division KSB1 bacterium]
MIGVILAGGKWRRFNSKTTKVMARYQGKELIRIVIDAMQPLVTEIIIIVPPDDDLLRRALADYDNIRLAIQPKPLGTGHALLTAQQVLQDRNETLLISFADKPLVTTSTFEKLIRGHVAAGHQISFTTAILDDPAQKGRIIRHDGVFQTIVEYKDADEKISQIKEINGGFICAESAELFVRLRRLGRDNAADEYYLSKVFDEYIKDNLPVGIVRVDGLETADINTIEQLENLLNKDLP